VDTFEAGYRAPLMDHQINVTSAVFYNDYKNLQVAAHANAAHAAIIEAIVNAGSARTYGVEGSIDWRIADPLTVGVAAGYLNAKYKDFQVTDATVLVPFNLSGQRMANAPKFQLALTADVDQPVNNNYNFVAHVLESHIASQLFIQSGLPGTLPDVVGPGYWITNLRIGLKTSDDKYSIYAYANNLFNAQYYTYGSSSAADGNLLSYGKPRIIGGEINVKF
jgi:iron complex outermembrane receptor protein